MNWLIPVEMLTAEQRRAMEFASCNPFLVAGGPSTGKTQALLHRARYLCDTLKSSPNRFRILVHTDTLVHYMKPALHGLQLPEDSVMTFNRWCYLFFRDRISNFVPWNAARRQPHFEKIRAEVRLWITSHDFILPIYDFVLIDELHNFSEEGVSVLARIASHATGCFDPLAHLPGNTFNRPFGRPRLRNRTIHLAETFDANPYLVEIGAEFLPDGACRCAFRGQHRTMSLSRETPLLYLARNVEDELKKLFEVLRDRQLMNESVGILLPKTSQVYLWAEWLNELGLDVETPEETPYSSIFNFSSSCPKLLTYREAAGLKFDSVLLPRLTEKSFSAYQSSEINLALFLALTRAKRWCYLSTTAAETLPNLSKLFRRELTLSILRYGDSSVSKSTVAFDSISNVCIGPDDTLNFL
jgi:superfamily I DNA/RNA helicase